MTIKPALLLCCAVAALTLARPLAAHAQTVTAPLADERAEPAPPPETPSAGLSDRARFSWKRWLVESLAGGLVGSLAAYVTYGALCEEEDSGCLGAALAGLGVNFLVTSPTAWAVGTAMGGEGKLSWTYLGALIAFSGSAPAGQEALVLAVGAVLMPFTSAAFYELSSQMRWARSRQVVGGVTPVADESGGLGGATLTFRGAF